MVDVNITHGMAKEFADLARDTGNSFNYLTATVIHTYAPQLRTWATQNLFRCKR